jgi:hypothetical protein
MPHQAGTAPYPKFLQKSHFSLTLFETRLKMGPRCKQRPYDLYPGCPPHTAHISSYSSLNTAAERLHVLPDCPLAIYLLLPVLLYPTQVPWQDQQPK